MPGGGNLTPAATRRDLVRLADDGVSTFVLPTQQLAVIVGLAVLAGVLAALGPARRAGRLNVLEAIATQ